MERKTSTGKILSTDQIDELIAMLKMRFNKHLERHAHIEWANVEAKIRSESAKLWSLNAMEETGGEPDVVAYDELTDEYLFYDCAFESPKGRRSLCYDEDALLSRKEHKPKHSVLGMAVEMGINVLTEEEYFHLQSLGQFDTKTSSWIETPPDIREKGGALFGDRRFGRVFVYHNGAESYYGARAFRAKLKI